MLYQALGGAVHVYDHGYGHGHGHGAGDDDADEDSVDATKHYRVVLTVEKDRRESCRILEAGAGGRLGPDDHYRVQDGKEREDHHEAHYDRHV